MNLWYRLVRYLPTDLYKVGIGTLPVILLLRMCFGLATFFFIVLKNSILLFNKAIDRPIQVNFLRSKLPMDNLLTSSAYDNSIDLQRRTIEHISRSTINSEQRRSYTPRKLVHRTERFPFHENIKIKGRYIYLPTLRMSYRYVNV